MPDPAGAFPDYGPPPPPRPPRRCYALKGSDLRGIMDFCDHEAMPYDPVTGWCCYGSTTRDDLDRALREGSPAFQLLQTGDGDRLLLVETATDRVVAIGRIHALESSPDLRQRFAPPIPLFTENTHA